jgi:hypothetical protein
MGYCEPHGANVANPHLLMKYFLPTLLLTTEEALTPEWGQEIGPVTNIKMQQETNMIWEGLIFRCQGILIRTKTRLNGKL